MQAERVSEGVVVGTSKRVRIVVGEVRGEVITGSWARSETRKGLQEE